jgi:crotonobetainyl-CoA:carnitine CoA-transferase CaiB-like acyl-CoA transferase
VIAAGNDRQFVELCRVLALDGLLSGGQFATNAKRVENRATLIPLIAGATRSRASAELCADLEVAGVPAGVVNNVDDVFANPHVVARGLQIEAASTECALPGVASPIVIDGVRMVSRRASPMLGEHNQAPRWLPRHD